jgi:hypothetical protein
MTSFPFWFFSFLISSARSPVANGIKSSFSITDRLEYQATIITKEERPFMEAIVSNVKTFVEGQQSLFDTLWSNALPAEKRIREIEEELRPRFIESISDPYEIYL